MFRTSLIAYHILEIISIEFTVIRTLLTLVESRHTNLTSQSDLDPAMVDEMTTYGFLFRDFLFSQGIIGLNDEQTFSE